MKLILPILLLAVTGPVAAQTSSSPHRYKGTKNKSLSPKADAGVKPPAHKGSAVAVPSAKAGGVDPQLKELEKQQSKMLSGKPAGAKRPATPAKSAEAKTTPRTGQAMNFKYEPEKAGVSNRQGRSGNQPKTAHGRVNGH